jgi:hypothetical protein
VPAVSATEPTGRRPAGTAAPAIVKRRRPGRAAPRRGRREKARRRAEKRRGVLRAPRPLSTTSFVLSRCCCDAMVVLGLPEGGWRLPSALRGGHRCEGSKSLMIAHIMRMYFPLDYWISTTLASASTWVLCSAPPDPSDAAARGRSSSQPASAGRWRPNQPAAPPMSARPRVIHRPTGRIRRELAGAPLPAIGDASPLEGASPLAIKTERRDGLSSSWNTRRLD